jgi:SNF2-related domain
VAGGGGGPIPNVRRTFSAKVYTNHPFWSALWRPNKSYWQRLGFSVFKPGEDWLVTFRFKDISRLPAAIAASKEVTPKGTIAVPSGLAYFEYQVAGIEFLAEHPVALLADEPGVGKGIQTIGLLNKCPEIARVLIICPASVKYVWDRELRKWLLDKNRSISVAGKTLDASADILVINYDLLRKYSVLFAEISFDLVVLDEAHYIKTPGALRSKAAKALALKSSRRVLLTGTPIMSRPGELWNLLTLLDAKAWGPFFPFAKRYCDAKRDEFGHWDFSGASHLEELSVRLRSSGMFLRRTKADVLARLDMTTSFMLERLRLPMGAIIQRRERSTSINISRRTTCRLSNNSWPARRPGSRLVGSARARVQSERVSAFDGCPAQTCSNRATTRDAVDYWSDAGTDRTTTFSRGARGTRIADDAVRVPISLEPGNAGRVAVRADAGAHQTQDSGEGGRPIRNAC